VSYGLEGPLVGTGYFEDRKRSASAYVTDPAWMLRDRSGHPGRRGRAYRTGDLVRYALDGSMEFVVRNNTQMIKIRGQRVDLLDVQHNVQDVLRKAEPKAQGKVFRRNSLCF
jgi:non-ribosomal peptide synthetase component F